MNSINRKNAEEYFNHGYQTEDNNNVSMVYDTDTVDFGVSTAVRTNRYAHHENHYQHSYYSDAEYSVIDNRKLSYIPIRLSCGVCAYVSPEVLSECPTVLGCIQADLIRALAVLPFSVHGLIRNRTNIWLNLESYSYGQLGNPTILRHVTTHHAANWLVEVACDTPKKAMGIEIYSVIDYQHMRLHWNGSGLLLHELCHLIHQCCLEDGLGNKAVEALFEYANESGKYEKVLRRDWAGKTIDFDLHYAMIDHKECFAEMSVAYLCDGYRRLDEGDFNDMNSCNPPLLHPDVIERVLVKNEYDANMDTDIYTNMICTTSVFREKSMCNKFYPFTRGQLKYYDYKLFTLIRDIWKKIALWKDPYDSSFGTKLRQRRCGCCCCTFFSLNCIC